MLLKRVQKTWKTLADLFELTPRYFQTSYSLGQPEIGPDHQFDGVVDADHRNTSARIRVLFELFKPVP